ncbi:Tn3 family transposase, partial [Streptomyces sp. NPDC127197]|uniref:Tn3 family transposase n=1 Tax=Streptomyces sp. NPDC127197 TaxID=3345388 RepID=UPI00362EA2AF
QVCDRDPYADRVDRGDPAPLHPQRLPPHLRGHAGDRGGPEHDGVLQRRQLRDRVRQGRGVASNRRDEQEMFVLCLRILQSALVFVNTLMLQDILRKPEWADLLTPADRRALTPLFWFHVRSYEEVNLDMGARLKLAAVTVPSPRASADAEDGTASRT